jgi:hypothetical protein
VNSSTSNSRDAGAVGADGRLRYLAAVPREKRARAALVLASLAATVVLGLTLLKALFYERNFQRLAVEALSPETEVLALGSSRVFYGVNPALYPRKTVSLAGNYLDCRAAMELWELHAARVPNVRLVVLELDLVSLALDARVLAPEALYPLGIAGWPTLADALASPDKALRRLLLPIFRWRLTPAYVDKHERIMHSPHEPQTTVAGHVPSDLVVGAPAFYAERKVRQGEEILAKFGEETKRTNAAALLELARAVARRGARLALLRFPLAPDLRTVYPEAWHREVARAEADLAQRLAAEGLARPVYWDLTLDERFTTPEFRDPDHLNSHGAAELARVLAPLLEGALR